VFAVGWAKRGPTGTIPTNRAESHAVASRCRLAEGARSQERPDPMPLASTSRAGTASTRPRSRPAPSGPPRVKLTDWKALLDVAQRAERPILPRSTEENLHASFHLHRARLPLAHRPACAVRRPCSRSRCIPISRSSIRSGPRR
jgi:hypothetical protein